jgi:transcription-repair coupling factor (superfamily II helicase)
MNPLWQESTVAKLRAALAPPALPVHPPDESPALWLPDLPPSAEAWVVWSLLRQSGQTLLWIGDGPRTLDSFHRDLTALAPPGAEAPLLFPNWEAWPDDTEAPPDRSVTAARLETLRALSQPGPPRLIATCIQALLEVTLSRPAFAAHTLTFAPGDAMPPAALAERLLGAGYRFGVEVQAPGEAAVRGGILDVWPLTTSLPLRLEFFGDELESIRQFDPAAQTSQGRVPSVTLPPAGEWELLKASADHRATLVTHLPAGLTVFWSDLDRVRAHADLHEEAARARRGAGGFTPPLAAIEAALRAPPANRHVFMGAQPDLPAAGADPALHPQDSMPAADRRGLHPDLIEAARTRFLNGETAAARAGDTLVFFFDSEGTRDRFREQYARLLEGLSPTFIIAPLSGGFTARTLGLRVVAEPDLYGRKQQRRGRAQPGPAAGARITDWTDMEPGNLVVHAEHGVGRYLGLREITVNNRLQEVLAVEYAEGAKLYVPVAQAHLMTRYVGVGRRHVTLHPLGGKRWDREKLAAAKAVQDLAGTLLETQAARDAQEGFAFPADVPWQRELEDAFPYQETEDQAAAIREVKQDMETRRPMDRLLCGDAGYGKTEVAVRAAFKAVMAGKQVAVLVPTTILAQQHFATFLDRMAPFPVRIEMLSRFRTQGEAARIHADLRTGAVDIVIGTHALLQPDIAFHDLGLVIIDEEQRFGVLHKERFKHLRRLVDVLTLTATPIPRTLYMSLTGARDLSTIQTPPQERLAVETLVTPASDAVIRDAILRELNREGQAFYLHNRVRTIERARDRLQRLAPEARIEIGHGQMTPGALAEVMRRFAAGEFDVLLCTTIIESGLDVPNANTILIDRADRFGLAELYQLRGRVGRSRHAAYAYMLLPTQAHVDPTARRRIQAIKQYSGAGAGFRLAMRDLEIRGAGNLLGAAQSGHIAAVGFGLYCQLLRRTIAVLKGETPPPVIEVTLALDFISLSPSDAGGQQCAMIPVSYVEDERLRVSMYRRIAELAEIKEARRLRQEFRDRFGRLPAECERLLKLAELRILASENKISSIEVEDGKIMFKRGADYLMTGGRFPRLRTRTPDARLEELRRRLKDPDG